MKKNNQSPFSFDWVTIVALLCVGVAWFSWQDHMKKTYPDLYKRGEKVSDIESVKERSFDADGLNNSNLDGKRAFLKKKTSGEDGFSGSLIDSSKDGFSKEEKEGSIPIGKKKKELQKSKLQNLKSKKPSEFKASKEVKEKLVVFEDDVWSFSLSSRGMGIRNFHLKKFFDRKSQFMSLGGKKLFLPFQTHIAGHKKPLHFEITRQNDKEFIGKAKVGDVQITNILHVDSKKYLFKMKLQVEDEEMSFPGLSILISDKRRLFKSEGFFLPSFGHQEFYVSHFDGKERIEIGEENLYEEVSRVKVTSLNSRYFAIALMDQSQFMPKLEMIVNKDEAEAFGVITYKTLQPEKKWDINFTAFMGPKSYEILKSTHKELFHIMDFGIFGFIAKYMLLLMNFFFKIFHNWGFAIIMMTVLVRLILLPLNLKSYRSMKSMQVIQPQIKKLREELKDTPQKMNQEVMALMRTHKVNPLGGCLPMLLQFPIFIALYKVLGQSVELYQAPFIFWVKDLSVKDPYYILPLLMGVTMFLQQKVSPTTMDRMQARILMVMPVIFTFFMLTLPSGLALYIFISSLFAFVQQIVFMKEKSS